MKYKPFVAFLLLLLVTGCAAPNPVTAVREHVVIPAANMMPVTIRLKIVRISPNFLSRRVTDKLVRARDIFASYGVGMEVVSLIELDRPEWLKIDENDLLSLDLYSRNTPEHIVFLVEEIQRKGKQAGGVGSRDWMAVQVASWDSVIAHEAAHPALRLANIDQDNNKQGHRETPFNLMATLNVTKDHVRLEDDQANALRGWAKLRWGN
jgi:hypothetical protein